MPHLILARDVGQSVMVDFGGIVVRVTPIHANGRDKVKLLFDAPSEVVIDREEVYGRRQKEKGGQS